MEARSAMAGPSLVRSWTRERGRAVLLGPMQRPLVVSSWTTSISSVGGRCTAAVLEP